MSNDSPVSFPHTPGLSVGRRQILWGFETKKDQDHKGFNTTSEGGKSHPLATRGTSQKRRKAGRLQWSIHRYHWKTDLCTRCHFVVWRLSGCFSPSQGFHLKYTLSTVSKWLFIVILPPDGGIDYLVEGLNILNFWDCLFTQMIVIVSVRKWYF